jgi:hypothetical protein
MQLGVLSILGIAFVILKLTGVIAWSWLWVTAPFWGGFVLLFLFLVLFFAALAGRALIR